MALFDFGKKKKKEFKGLEKPSFPPLDIPKFERTNFPEFEPTPISSSEIDIPVRKPMLPREPMFMEKETRAQGPLFVKISKYKSVLSQMDIIRARLKEAETVLDKLMEIKATEDREIEKWMSDLAEIKEKLISIDNSLFEI